MQCLAGGARAAGTPLPAPGPCTPEGGWSYGKPKRNDEYTSEDNQGVVGGPRAT